MKRGMLAGTRQRLRCVSAIALMLAAVTARADWMLDHAASSVEFTSTKNDAVAETHRVATFSGAIAADGKATIALQLNSVDSGIAIRDERMREHLFETDLYPVANIETQINPDDLRDIKVGEVRTLEAPLLVDLHGIRANVSAKLRVTRLAEDRVTVATATPVLLRAADFQLSPGIDKLREIAGLNSIAKAVPVTVYLEWQQR